MTLLAGIVARGQTYRAPPGQAVEAAQIVELLPQQLRAIEYWRWDELPTVGATEDEAD